MSGPVAGVPGWRRPRRLGCVVEPGAVFLAPLPTGPIARLEGSAATIWQAAVSVPAADVVEHVAAEFGVDAATIGPDVEAFLDDLQARGFLERCGGVEQ